MTTDYLAHAREFLAKHSKELDDIYVTGSFFAFCYKHKLKFDAGATRRVIIGEDFVIKFDKKHVGPVFSRFGNCYQEYKNWQMVQKDGYDYMFAAVTKIKGGHHYYYVMPKINTEHEYTDYAWDLEELSDDEREYLMENFEDLHDNNYGFDDEGNLKIFDYAVTSEYYYSH